MQLIIGLGNPGPEYAKTRHNLGFMVLDKLNLKFKLEKKLTAEISKDKNYICAKPQTYMNDSGLAVKKLCQFYKIKPDQLWVIQDDKDMILGKIRIRHMGSSGGHNGINSIIKELGTDKFNRIKIGIAPTDQKINATVDWVLGKFTKAEMPEINKAIDAVIKIIKTPINLPI